MAVASSSRAEASSCGSTAAAAFSSSLTSTWTSPRSTRTHSPSSCTRLSSICSSAVTKDHRQAQDPARWQPNTAGKAGKDQRQHLAGLDELHGQQSRALFEAGQQKQRGGLQDTQRDASLSEGQEPGIFVHAAGLRGCQSWINRKARQTGHQQIPWKAYRWFILPAHRHIRLLRPVQRRKVEEQKPCQVSLREEPSQVQSCLLRDLLVPLLSAPVGAPALLADRWYAHPETGLGQVRLLPVHSKAAARWFGQERGAVSQTGADSEVAEQPERGLPRVSGQLVRTREHGWGLGPIRASRAGVQQSQVMIIHKRELLHSNHNNDLRPVPTALLLYD